jgi:(p)ppGpp synthase/HD superfamily hydrolase
VELAELEQRFGDEVARLVRAVSEPSSEGSYRERKARLRAAVSSAEGNAVTTFAADKVAKTRELRMRLARTPGHAPDPEKLDHYWASLELLEVRLGHHPLVRQLRFELEALAVLPPSFRA